MTAPDRLNPSLTQHLARIVEETVRHEALRLQIADTVTPGDRSPDDVLRARMLTSGEVTAYVLAALDLARTQLAPMSAPDAQTVTLTEHVSREWWDQSELRSDIREHLRGRWARELEHRDMRPSTWPAIEVSPVADYGGNLVRLTLTCPAVPNPTDTEDQT